MTTIIKSDNIAKNTIGHVSGFKGPNDFAAFLDFNRDNYLTNIGGTITDYTLEQSINVERNGVANVVDENGLITEVPADTPRRSYNFHVEAYGLCGEPPATNLVTTPSNPETQPVTITAGSSSENIFVTVYGAGSASLSAPELTLVSGFDASLGIAAEYSRSTSSAISATLTIVGTPTFVQVEVKANASTPIASDRESETVGLSANMRSVITSNEYTIVASLNPIYDVPTNNRGALAVVYSNGDLLAIRCSENKVTTTTDSLVEKVSGVQTALQSIVGRGTGGNYSINRSEANGLLGFTAIRDASRGDDGGYVDGIISDILLMGGADIQGTASGNYGGTCQYVAIYNRHLTDQELASCALGPIVY